MCNILSCTGAVPETAEPYPVGVSLLADRGLHHQGDQPLRQGRDHCCRCWCLRNCSRWGSGRQHPLLPGHPHRPHPAAGVLFLLCWGLQWVPAEGHWLRSAHYDGQRVHVHPVHPLQRHCSGAERGAVHSIHRHRSCRHRAPLCACHHRQQCCHRHRHVAVSAHPQLHPEDFCLGPGADVYSHIVLDDFRHCYRRVHSSGTSHCHCCHLPVCSEPSSEQSTEWGCGRGEANRLQSLISVIHIFRFDSPLFFSSQKEYLCWTRDNSVEVYEGVFVCCIKKKESYNYVLMQLRIQP